MFGQEECSRRVTVKSETASTGGVFVSKRKRVEGLRMILSALFICGSITLALPVLTQSQTTNPFVGNWSLNAQKSDVSGDKLVIKRLAADEMQLETAGMSYKFKVDGKPYEAFFTARAAWKQVDKNTWQVENTGGGKLLWTDTFVVSPDGKLLSIKSKGFRPNGQSFEDTQTYTRASGDSLVGEWQGKSFNAESVATIRFEAAAGDGLTLTIPGMDASVQAKFDKQEYPVKGPLIAPQYTATLTKVDERTIRYDEKQAGKPVFVRTFQVSSDGKVMTMTLAPAAVGSAPLAKIVYDRQ